MWSSSRFREYLQQRGQASAWGSVIYPAMKRAVAHTMRVAQGHVAARRNSFELYGADFVLGRDFRPWLIEINSSPSMHASTPVTAQLCAQVQEDVIRVVVGRRDDRGCDIGNFELLWRQVGAPGGGPAALDAGGGGTQGPAGMGATPVRGEGQPCAPHLARLPLACRGAAAVARVRPLRGRRGREEGPEARAARVPLRWLIFAPGRSATEREAARGLPGPGARSLTGGPPASRRSERHPGARLHLARALKEAPGPPPSSPVPPHRVWREDGVPPL